MDVDKTGLLRIWNDQKHTAETKKKRRGKKRTEISRRCSQATQSASHPQRILSYSWMKMALDFWSKHLLLLLATGNPRMWPRNPWQPPIQGLRMSSSSAETAVSRKIQIMGTRNPLVSAGDRFSLRGMRWDIGCPYYVCCPVVRFRFLVVWPYI